MFGRSAAVVVSTFADVAATAVIVETKPAGIRAGSGRGNG